MWTLAWVCATGGLILGGLASFVPGFPGAAVALLGLVAFAGLTGFEGLSPEALAVATLVALAGSFGQLMAPVLTSRAAGGAAGAATGAALGAIAGALLPVPGLALALSAVGAVVLGVLGAKESWLQALRGMVGAGGGCAVAVLADLVAVVGLAAILALSDVLRLVAA